LGQTALSVTSRTQRVAWSACEGWGLLWDGPCHEPTRLAHLDYRNHRGILFKGGNGFVGVIRLRHGAPRRLARKAPKVPHPRRLPHSISFGGERSGSFEHPTIRRLTSLCRHQLPPIALAISPVSAPIATFRPRGCHRLPTPGHQVRPLDDARRLKKFSPALGIASMNMRTPPRSAHS
jgi:hypothetical protein